jgi:hypothetical protein
LSKHQILPFETRDVLNAGKERSQNGSALIFSSPRGRVAAIRTASGTVFEMVMARSSAIARGHEDANDLDGLRHDPLMKITVGRCPQSGAALASQSTIGRLENAPSRSEAARLCAALVDQFGETIKPGALEILDIDDTFCAAHGGQQLAFWNAHHDERGFASMHIFATILRPARTRRARR